MRLIDAITEEYSLQKAIIEALQQVRGGLYEDLQRHNVSYEDAKISDPKDLDGYLERASKKITKTEEEIRTVNDLFDDLFSSAGGWLESALEQVKEKTLSTEHTKFLEKFEIVGTKDNLPYSRWVTREEALKLLEEKLVLVCGSHLHITNIDDDWWDIDQSIGREPEKSEEQQFDEAAGSGPALAGGFTDADQRT